MFNFKISFGNFTGFSSKGRTSVLLDTDRSSVDSLWRKHAIDGAIFALRNNQVFARQEIVRGIRIRARKTVHTPGDIPDT